MDIPLTPATSPSPAECVLTLDTTSHNRNLPRKIYQNLTSTSSAKPMIVSVRCISPIPFSSLRTCFTGFCSSHMHSPFQPHAQRNMGGLSIRDARQLSIAIPPRRASFSSVLSILKTGKDKPYNPPHCSHSHLPLFGGL